jgi:hypothetical protein
VYFKALEKTYPKMRPFFHVDLFERGIESIGTSADNLAAMVACDAM